MKMNKKVGILIFFVFFGFLLPLLSGNQEEKLTTGKTEEYSLLESYILLCLNGEKGYFLTEPQYMNCAIAGIALYQLNEKKRIVIDERKVKFIYSLSVGDAFLDDILNQIAIVGEDLSLDHWLVKLQSRASQEKWRIMGQFQSQGILAKKIKKSFVFFRLTRYPMVETGIRERIKESLNNSVFIKESIDNKDRFLASLLYSSYLGRKIFSQNVKYKKTRKVLREYVHSNEIAFAVDDVIDSMRREDDLLDFLLLQSFLNF